MNYTLLIGTIIVGIALTACQATVDSAVTGDVTGTNQQEQHAPTPGETDGYSRTVIALTDNAVDMSDITHIYFTVSDVKVHSASQGWIMLNTQEQTYDLLELKTQHKNVILADKQLDTGEYDAVSFDVDEVIVYDTQGGIEVATIPHKQYEISTVLLVEDQGDSVVSLDVLAHESLFVNKDQEYIFAPVVAIKTIADTDVALTNDEVNFKETNVIDDKTVSINANGNVGVGLDYRSQDVINIQDWDLFFSNNGSSNLTLGLDSTVDATN